MFSTDPTHLRRYFATLGVAIAAGTLSLAGLFLKLQQDLLVPQSILARLTPTARNTLMRRQEYLSLGTTILPWFVLVGFLIGIGLTAYGMIGWARRQKVIDEREDIGLYKERAELRQLTDAEKADKLDREAEESVGEPSESVGEQPADLTEILRASVRNARQASIRSARTEIAIIESALKEKLRAIYPGEPGNVLSSVVAGRPGERYEVDAAVMAEPQPILFELKYASSAVNINKQIISGLQQLARATSAVPNARAVLVIIGPDDATPAQVEQWRERAIQMAADYRSIIGVYVDRYSDFIALPAQEFAARLRLPKPPSE
jgi:hypothetical protein